MHPSVHLNTADYLIIATVVISGAVGLLRGLLREVMAVITWIAAAFIAWHFSGSLEPHLGGLLAQPAVRPWVARLILFVVVLLIGHGIGAIVGHFVRLSLLTGVDRFLGLVFGLLRGVLIVGAAVIVCEPCAWTVSPGGMSRRCCPMGRMRRPCCGRWVATGSNTMRLLRQSRCLKTLGGRTCAE